MPAMLQLRPRAVLVAALAAAAALPAAAQAATISYDGDTLVYTAGAGERNSLYVGSEYNGPRVRISDSGAAIASVDARCEIPDGDVALCAMPARMRFVLADGADSFATSDGSTLTLPIAVDGGDGDDALDGNPQLDAPETLLGGPGRDRLRGFGGNDDLRGGAGDDRLEGGAGNDTVLGEEGNDELTGDDQAAPGADLVDGGPGIDTMKEYVEYGTDIHPPANVSLDGIANDGRPGESDDVRSIERMTAYVSGAFVGSDADEEWQIWSNMNSGTSTVSAGAGNDTITGEDAIEIIDGGPGNDVLEGGLNSDTITGGPGQDRIFGDDTDTSRCRGSYVENCILYGNDTIYARDGERDEVDCGPGQDRVVADAIDVLTNCEMVELPAGGGPVQDGAGGGKADGGGKASTATKIGCKKLPKLKNLTTTQAKARLKKAKCKGRVVVKKAKSKTVKKGRVVKATAKGRTITLVLSRGRR
jgi:Ca2+-binding RTX toxin-like protein